MTNHKNIIQKQTIELIVSDKNKAGQYSDEFRNLYYSELLPAIDQVLSDFADTDQRIILDNVYLDLGYIQARDFKRSLKSILQKQLDQYLQTNIYIPVSNYPGKPYRVAEQETRDLDFLIYFLKTGNIPWWVPHEEKPDLKLVWESSIEHNRIVFYDEIKKVLEEEAGFKRVFSFLEDKRFFKTASKFTPGITRKIITKIISLLRTLPSFSKIPVTEFIHLFKKYYFTKWRETTVSDFQNLTIHQMFLDFTVSASLTLNIPVKKIIKQLYLISDSKAEEYLPADIFISIKESLSKLPETNKEKSIKKEEIDISSVLASKKIVAEKATKSILKEEQDKILHPSQTKKEVLKRELIPDRLVEPEEEKIREDPSLRIEKPGTDNDNFYINNAGLVLLWPFLNNFFVATELMTQGKWNSPESEHLAVLSLQYMVTGNELFEEHECLLSKILCGLQYDDYIDTRLRLGNKIKAESRDLLKDVIKHWSVLKNTSVEGFQNSFLSREGKLKSGETGWKLMVQWKGLDVLLEKLPWAISVIKLSWMNKPLYVEW